MEAKEFLQSLGIGLSRAVRYTFGGFVAIVVAYLLDSDAVTDFVDTVGWQLTGLCAIVTGMGIYAFHRSLIIPIHHFVGVLLLNTGEFVCYLWRRIFNLQPNQWNDRKSHSLSPTRWLAYLGVPFFRRMLAYARLRRDFFDEEERNSLDVVHAESGLTVMISEALFAMSIYYYLQKWPYCHDIGFVLLLIGLVLFILSALSGIQQHRVECARFKEEQTRVEELIGQFILRPQHSERP
jgi:hypothetical protein